MKKTISIILAAVMLLSVFVITPITVSAASEFDCNAFTVLSPLSDEIYTVGTTVNVSIRVKKFTFTYGSNGLPTSSDTNYVCLEYYRDGVPHYQQYSSTEYYQEDVGSILDLGDFQMSLVGNYEVKVKYKSDYVGSYNFTVVKADNPIAVTAATKSIKASALKKSKKTVKPLKIKKAEGTVKVVKVKSGTTGSIYKKTTVNKNNGAITFKKGTYKKGTYKVNLKISAAGNKNYKSKTVTKTVKIKIK
ncbi:MAG: hypothetical protein IJ903_05795 [Ruminococcus sp.]|nr:hypothetical protein [Ruminococcus sp.]